jgi:hypothetical protein
MASVSGAKPIALFSLQKTAKTASAQSHSVDAARRFLRAFPAKDARVDRSSSSMLADFLTASLADNPHLKQSG